MSMANSVELRPLFLDHEFVDFLFTIPHHYKIRGLSEKHIFKKSMEGFLPQGICRRTKQPLQPPAGWFIRTAGDMLRDLLSPPAIRETGYFNPAFVNFILSEHDAGGPIDYAGVIVVVFFMQLWHKIFFGLR